MQINIKKLLDNNFIDKLIQNSTQLYIGWVLFIALLTLLPGQAMPDIEWNFIAIDKIAHVSMFLGMAFLGALTFRHKYKNMATVSALSSLIALSYGFTLEYFQTFIPQRTYDYADLIANTVGVVVGIVIFLIFQRVISLKE